MGSVVTTIGYCGIGSGEDGGNTAAMVAARTAARARAGAMRHQQQG